jgi:anti-sigma regulatory factor (Ser/Thr protein kinase)
LLPSRFPRIDDLEAAARYVPGTHELEVGGDWYDVFELGDGSIGVTVGDVMGRGIHAAATMGHLRHVLRAHAIEGLTPGETLARLNHTAAESEIFATVVYAIVSPSRTSIRIANAGHPPPLIRSADGSVRRIDDGRSLPIGAFADTTFADAELQVDPDFSLVVYTDGLVERRGESIDAGIDQLAAIVGPSAGSAHELIDEVFAEFEFGDHPDDRALLAVRICPLAPDRMSLRLAPDSSSLASARASLGDWLRDHGGHEEEIFEIVFAVNEACSNAIEHPLDVQAEEIGLDAELSSGRVAIVVNDRGRWRSESASRDRGRGLELMHAFMEKVEIVQSSDGTSVRLERTLSNCSTP